jgi:hypothetical protein
MRIIFGKLFLAPVLMATAALASTSAMAEATVNVPFTFTVAGKNCPAGPYSVKRDALRNLLILQSKNSSQTFSWIFRPAETASDTKVTLKFDGLGETHALQSVQYGQTITPQLEKKVKQNEHRHAQTIEGQ